MDAGSFIEDTHGGRLVCQQTSEGKLGLQGVQVAQDLRERVTLVPLLQQYRGGPRNTCARCRITLSHAACQSAVCGAGRQSALPLSGGLQACGVILHTSCISRKGGTALLQGGSNRPGCDVAQIAASAIAVLVTYKDCDYGQSLTESDGSQGESSACNVANNGHCTGQ